MLFTYRLTLSNYYRPALHFSKLHPAEPFLELNRKGMIKSKLERFTKVEDIPIDILARVMCIARRPVTVETLREWVGQPINWEDMFFQLEDF